MKNFSHCGGTAETYPKEGAFARPPCANTNQRRDKMQESTGVHGITKSLRGEGYEHTKAISDDREGLTEVVNLQLMRHLSLITFLLRKSEPSNPPPRGWSTGSRRLRKVSNG